MGDFDKNKAPDAAAEKKKLMLVGVLGAVLLGVVSFHFMKGGPQAASASVVSDSGGASALPAIEETPAQAEAALADDPTASLLRGKSTATDPTLVKTPHNPVVISAEWRNELVHPTEVRIVNHEPVYVAPSPQALNVGNFKLRGIMHENNTLCAISNGQIVSAGMVLDDAKVVEITPNRVLLQRADSPTGPKSELTMEPKL
jgi:hypothetical protein